MNKLLASLADSYGLYRLHKNYSNTTHFYYNKTDIINLNKNDLITNYDTKTLPEIKYENNKLTFLSSIDNEECNREAVFYTNLYGKENKKNINVVMIHGWRAEKLNHLENLFLKDFKRLGYNTYSYILPFHMDRCSQSSLYNGECFISANINRTLKSIQQAISDIKTLITFIKQNKEEKIIIIGLSLGGIVSNLLSEFEEKIDVLISLFYANDLAFSIFESEAGKYIKNDFEENNFKYDKLKECWNIINPSVRKPIIDTSKIFLASGEYDKYVLGINTDILWENWGRPKRNIYKCGHSGVILCKKKIKKDVLKFIEERV